MKIVRTHNINYPQDVVLHKNNYPIVVTGSGTIPVLCLGIGTLSQHSLSSRFRETFKIYSSDFYWVNGNQPITLSKLTIKQICMDIIETARQLKLKNYILLGHSVFGGLAIEVAKYQDPQLAGVIGIGATPGWDEKIIQFKNDYFDKHACDYRKNRFQQLQEKYQTIKNEGESLGSINAYYAESPKYFANDVSRNEILELWKGVECNDAVINHLFENLLVKYRFAENIEKVNVPVIIAGGRKDYDSVPLEIWKQFPTPKFFKLLDCGEVGHWPHLEDPETFDNGIEAWVEKAGFKYNA